MKKYLKFIVPSALVLVVGIALLIGRCDTGVKAYKGPVGDHPIAQIEPFRHLDGTGDPRVPEQWVTNNILHVTNPSDHDMDVVVDCDPDTRKTLRIKARTTQDMLLSPNDQSCEVSEQSGSLSFPPNL